jgi:hypothetical protein
MSWISTPPRERRPILSFSVSKSATISNPSRGTRVVGEREPEVAGPMMATRTPRSRPRICRGAAQLLHVVADAAHAELAEIGESLRIWAG